jgi:DNA-binding PadR family transcriptional regulator
MNHSEVNSELSLFSYEILGLVGRQGVGAHDLLRMVKRGRILAWAGESQYYVEPKRLAKLGYLDACREPGKTRDRTIYSLTEKGRQALAEYAATPATVLPFKSDALLRLLICDLVGEQATLESLGALRGDVADLRARLDETKRSAQELPHRERYLLIATDFLDGLLDLHDELVEKAERELAPTRRRGLPSHLMAYDEDLADRIRELVVNEPSLSEQKMFGGLAFLIGGNMAVAASGEGGILVHVEPAEGERLVANAAASPMVMRGKEMKGWLRVGTADLKTKRELAKWVDRGVGYARSLPAKTKKQK